MSLHETLNSRGVGKREDQTLTKKAHRHEMLGPYQIHGSNTARNKATIDFLIYF